MRVNKFKVWAVHGVLATLVVAVLAVPLALAIDYGGGSVQSYMAETSIDNGAIVVLADSEQGRVKVATQDQLQNMFGVTVDPQQLPLRITSGEGENEVFVAVSGTYNVLVSTQGGEIEAGDWVTLSSLNGVAMKASTEESTVLGRAASGFNGSEVVLGTTTLKDDQGNDNQVVKIGSVPVTIEVTRNPNEKSTKAKVPEILERIGQAVAEKEVSAVRIYISMAIAAVSMITAIMVIYSGVRNSIISIGRNPMSKKSIFRALAEIILTSLLILIIGLFAVYLLLRL